MTLGYVPPKLSYHVPLGCLTIQINPSTVSLTNCMFCMTLRIIQFTPKMKFY